VQNPDDNLMEYLRFTPSDGLPCGHTTLEE